MNTGGIKAIGEYAGFISLYVDGYSSRSLTRAMFNGTFDMNSMEALSFDSRYYEDQIYYVESWYIGKKYNLYNNNNHNKNLINNQTESYQIRKLNKVPFCEKCEIYTNKIIGPPNLDFLTITKHTPTLSWANEDNNNNNTTAANNNTIPNTTNTNTNTMTNHIIQIPIASCLNKATRYSTDNYFYNKIQKFHSNIANINNYTILEVSPPSTGYLI